MMQRHHEHLTPADLNGFLDAGAVTVWVHRHTNGTLDVILDHPEIEPHTGAVLMFLESVNASVLDEAMAKNHRLSQSPGTVALRTLIDLAGGSQ